MIIVGIDLGTSNCCISYIQDGILKIIKDNNKFFIPSLVNIEENGILIGNEINKYHIKNTVAFI